MSSASAAAAVLPLNTTEREPVRLLPAGWTPPPATAAQRLATVGLAPAALPLDLAAAYLGVSEGWLEQSAVPVVLVETTGKSGRKLRRWRVRDLDAFLASRLVTDPRFR
jgi:hypothetical protein